MLHIMQWCIIGKCLENSCVETIPENRTGMNSEFMLNIFHKHCELIKLTYGTVHNLRKFLGVGGRVYRILYAAVRA